MYNMPLSQKRMKDEELILRFLALFYDLDKYEKPMNSFLSDFLGKNRNPTPPKLEEIKNLFQSTIKFVKEKIGLDAFRPKRNLNIAAYDSVMYVIAKYKSELKEDLITPLKELFDNSDYQKYITEGTTDPATITNRIRLTKEYLVQNGK